MEIDELKNIYKEKKATDEITEAGQYDSMMIKLRKAERKVWFRSITMSFFMLFAVYTLGGKAVSVKQHETLTYAGFYLIFAAMAAVLMFVWSSVIVLKKKEVVTPSIQFLKRAHRKLARRSLIRRIVIPIYLVAITVGITLVYIEVLAPLELLYRLLIHMLVIVFIVGISYIASRRERKRYETIYKPLQLQIEGLLKDYETIE
jgi:fatty acid desaturase